jgi:hypothetical protein
MIKKYYNFIKESESETLSQKIGDESDSSKYVKIKEEITSMIKSTIESSGGEFSSFIDSFNRNPEDVKIEGLINDSDIYDFYLKWRNDIDEILNDINFFDEIPSEMNTFGLYDYIINGTERSVIEIVKTL